MAKQESNTGGVRFGAAYIRVSTDEQAELSPDSQIAEIQKYAQRENIVLLNDHIYIDEGISGKKADRRPEFLKMIATAKSPDCPFSVLLLWKFSRFARNQEESIFYKSILRSKCGVEVISVTEPLIAGPFGSLIERIIEWMDEFYSIRLAQEVKRSMTINAQRGVRQCTASFGYRIVDKIMVPNEDEARYVRLIFEWFNSGKGPYQIARELNAMGVTTHRGTKFENRTVEYIIRNPVYIGKLRWNPTGRTRRDFFNENIIVSDGGHAPLVTDQVWNAAQKRMNEVKLQWGYKARPTYELKHWLSGIVRCSSCGATLVFCKPHYYQCNNFCKGSCLTSQHIPVEVLEGALISKLKEDASSAELAYDITLSQDKDAQEMARLELMLKQAKQKETRLQDAYLAGVLDLDVFAAARKNIESEIKDVKSKIAELQKDVEKKDPVKELQSSIKVALETITSQKATLEAKNQAARSVIERCVFDKAASTLTITYRLTI